MLGRRPAFRAGRGIVYPLASKRDGAIWVLLRAPLARDPAGAPAGVLLGVLGGAAGALAGVLLGVLLGAPRLHPDRGPRDGLRRDGRALLGVPLRVRLHALVLRRALRLFSPRCPPFLANFW